MAFKKSKPSPIEGTEKDLGLSNNHAHNDEVVLTSDERSALEHKAQVEKKLVIRQDLVIMPLMSILYLMAYLDRSNLGNAKLQGLEDILDEKGDEFGWAGSIFYFGYVALAIPFTLYGKRFNPAKFMSLSVFGWGVASAASASSFNFGGLAASRFFIGFFEAGFGPTSVFYFTLWYTRREVAFRTSIFIGMAALAGAFGGLIGYGVSLVDSHISHWRILFLIEGLPNIVMAVLVFLFLPDRPETSKFLKNEEEREIAIERMNRGQQSEGENRLVLKLVLAAFKDWKIYSVALIKMGHDSALATISIFLPTIIKSLGYTNTEAQYMTIGPYMVAWVVMLSVSFAADYFRMRGPFLMSAGAAAVIGLVLVYTHPAEENPKVALAGIFTLLAGNFGCIPLELQWATDNAGAESKKLAALCILVVGGHCWSILASKSFPEKEAPRYVRGYGIVLTFLSLSCVVATVLHIRHRLVNARRDKRYGKPDPLVSVDTSEMGDDAPMFRYIV